MRDPKKRLRKLLTFDQRLKQRLKIPLSVAAGLDEAGRGPLAGPVVASAVVLHRWDFDLPIDDSKRLTHRARQEAFQAILKAGQIGIGFAGPEEIDRLGIQAACGVAMCRALEKLPVTPRAVFVDGPWIPVGLPFPAVPIVGGDSKSLRIACASIVAKVVRDRWMRQLDRFHPEYGFPQHKGYGTASHLKALRILGPTLFHRFSFQPIRL